LVKAVNDFFRNYLHIPLFKKLHDMPLDDYERLWFILMAERNLSGMLNVNLDAIGTTIFSRNADKINFCNTLHDKTNVLLTDKWVEFSSGGFFNSASLQLTLKTKQFLKPLGLEIRLDEEKSNEMLLGPET